MPWRETDVMQERIRFVALALKPSQSFSDLCDAFGISRTTGYRWLNRYYEHRSFTALTDRSRAPHHHPNQTAAAIEARIVALRREYGWGAKKLRILLAREGTTTVSLSTINRILKRQGLLRRKDAHRPAPTRFERKEPNQLWQVDFKGRVRVAGGHCYPLSILDDHSRFALGLYPLRSTGGRQTYACLVDTLKKYGVPQAMLMDHGTPWWNTNSYSGLSWVAVQLIKQGIRLYFSAYRHPQTQGRSKPSIAPLAGPLIIMAYRKPLTRPLTSLASSCSITTMCAPMKGSTCKCLQTAISPVPSPMTLHHHRGSIHKTLRLPGSTPKAA